jgi:hypothetical protein
MNLKEFSLEKAKAGAKVVYKSLKNDQEFDVEILYFKKKGMYPLIVLLDGDTLLTFTEDGRQDISFEPSLFMAPVKKKGWINIYRDRFVGHAFEVYDTKEKAEEERCDDFLDCIEIEYISE